jgi:hypothetical protein
MVLVLLLAASCSRDPEGIPPGDPDVTGEIRYEQAGARIAAYPMDFDPRRDTLPPDHLAETDSRGRFQFQSLPEGTYNLVAFRKDDGGAGPAAWIPGLRVDGIKTAEVPRFRLQPLGALRLPKSDGLGQGVGAWVAVGSPWFLDIRESDTSVAALVLPVPPGEYRDLRWIGGEAELDVNTLGNPLSVAPAETATVDIYHAWKHSRSYVLQDSLTLPSDAGGVPLLIRLDSSRFDFREARGEGQDLRFTGYDGLVLPHQVERWDSTGRRAEIWVRLPVPSASVAAGGRSIRMHWGRPEAPDVAPPFKVFPPSDGYAAVWHLAEEDSGANGSPTYRNSARDGDHGLDYLSGTDRGGVIGFGTGFDSKGYVRIPEASAFLRNPQTFTLTAWFQADTVDSLGSMIAALGESRGLRVDPVGGFRPFVFLDSARRSPDSGYQVLDGRWRHLAATYDGRVLRAYVDGRPADSLVLAKALDPARGTEFLLGAASSTGKGEAVLGRLDEVQVLTAARSANWIRFAYETQRPGAEALRY